jgi:hypothetical protein
MILHDLREALCIPTTIILNTSLALVNKQLLLVIYSPDEQNSQGKQTITIGR